jgi:hypothetical protein
MERDPDEASTGPGAGLSSGRSELPIASRRIRDFELEPAVLRQARSSSTGAAVGANGRTRQGGRWYGVKDMCWKQLLDHGGRLRML